MTGAINQDPYRALTNHFRRLVNGRVPELDHLKKLGTRSGRKATPENMRYRFNVLVRKGDKTGQKRSLHCGVDEIVLVLSGQFVNPNDFRSGFELIPSSNAYRFIGHGYNRELNPFYEAELSLKRAWDDNARRFFKDGKYHCFLEPMLLDLNISIQTYKGSISRM